MLGLGARVGLKPPARSFGDYASGWR